MSNRRTGEVDKLTSQIDDLNISNVSISEYEKRLYYYDNCESAISSSIPDSRSMPPWAAEVIAPLRSLSNAGPGNILDTPAHTPTFRRRSEPRTRMAELQVAPDWKLSYASRSKVWVSLELKVPLGGCGPRVNHGPLTGLRPDCPVHRGNFVCNRASLLIICFRTAMVNAGDTPG